MAIDISYAVKVPVYNSPLVVASGGKLYLAYPGGEFAAAGNQSVAPLRDNVLISMCFLNLAIYAVDGIDITTLPLGTGDVTPYSFVIGFTPPAAPALSSVGTSTLAAQTYFARVTYLTATGESVASTEASLAVPVNKLLKVTSPATSAGATTYNVYVSLTTNSETLQNSTPITIGTDWTEDSAGLTATGVKYPGGTTPTNCFLCCNWRGRFVLAGDSNNPQNFYMARVGVPTDWDFSQTDPAAAVAGNLSESGQIGEPIVALIPYTDDYMLIGCTNSLWMLQGDPADGGSITRVSDQMGLVSPNSWCVDPVGTLYFIARGGLYSVRPIWEFYQPPQLLSGETYDQYFQAIINGSFYISMQWDVDAKYLHIFATPTDDTQVGTHLIWDQRNGGLWPQVYPLAQGPTATCRYAANNISGLRAIMLGGWDGYVRSWTSTNLDDDGTAISAYAVLGPIKPDVEASIFSAVTIDFGETLATDADNWNASVLISAGPDAYSVTEGTPHSTANVPATLDRRQKTYRQRFRGGWFSMTISNETLDTYFSFESALLEFLQAGRNRERR